MELPGNAQVERIPSNVQFQSGPLSYTASYLLEGSVLKISRDYTARHTKSVCNSQDDVHWSAMREVLQRDLRGQVFFKLGLARHAFVSDFLTIRDISCIELA